MGIGNWLRERRERKDAEAVERAQDLALETPEERAYSSGDIEALNADNRAARRVGGSGSIDDVNRLGDF